ncbi:unnamed protein product [Adineta steineri]|uniref:NAD(P)(+)--arginine ADP-ribosyltransferase n=1 Tax=Adineta steineri TaxID=433720 RepID=A0A815W8L3_9BILA|nr:unnamed protein product [Adineta steineri]
MASSTTGSTSALRFADLGVLSKRMLAPIEGYENEPLVSLEDAVKPLVDIVPRVQRNVRIVKQNCEEPEDGLTSDESASIMLYTYESMPHEHSLYVILNAALRSEQRQKLIPWFLYLRLVLTALARLPSKRCTVNRGVREDLRSQYPKGKTIIWWGFSSCTSSIEVLECENFFGKTGTRTLFQIECNTGKDIKNHSFIQNEDEILLLPARQFSVKGCLDSGNGLHIIQLEETEPIDPLLEPVSVPASKAVSVPAAKAVSVPASKAVSVPAFKAVSVSASAAVSVPESSVQPKPKSPRSSKSTVQKPSAESKTTTTVLSKPPTHRNQELEQMIDQNKEKAYLRFYGKNLTDDDMDIMAYYLLRNNTTLTELNLSTNQLGDKGAQAAAKALQKNTTLTKLYLNQNQIGDEGAQVLGEALQNNTTLTILMLGNNQIGDKGAQALGEVLQKNATLIELGLIYNQIGDKGAQVLGEALQNNTTLTILMLGNNQIGDKGAQALGEVLQKNATLMRLHLCNNKIGDKGAQALGEALQNNSKIWGHENIAAGANLGDLHFDNHRVILCDFTIYGSNPEGTEIHALDYQLKYNLPDDLESESLVVNGQLSVISVNDESLIQHIDPQVQTLQAIQLAGEMDDRIVELIKKRRRDHAITLLTEQVNVLKQVEHLNDDKGMIAMLIRMEKNLHKKIKGSNNECESCCSKMWSS